jgi:hypothetical protein
LLSFGGRLEKLMLEMAGRELQAVLRDWTFPGMGSLNGRTLVSGVTKVLERLPKGYRVLWGGKDFQSC